VPAGVALIVDVETRALGIPAAVETPTVVAEVEVRTMDSSAVAELPTVDVDLDNNMEAPAAVDEARVQYQGDSRTRAAPPPLLHLAPLARSQADRLQLVLPFLSKAPSEHHRTTTPLPRPKGPEWMAMHNKDPRQSV
jgi:hypothetical protein